mgnify:CR=1 FL=1
MKYTIEQIKQGDDELILRYQNLNQRQNRRRFCQKSISTPPRKKN